MNSTIARRPEYRTERLMVRNKKGKVIFVTDGSLGKEDEAIGRDSARTRRGVDRLINDLHNHPDMPMLSEITKIQFKFMKDVSTFAELVTTNKGLEELDKAKEKLKPKDKDRFIPDYMG
jgi:hypothetical protein